MGQKFARRSKLNLVKNFSIDPECKSLSWGLLKQTTSMVSNSLQSETKKTKNNTISPPPTFLPALLCCSFKRLKIFLYEKAAALLQFKLIGGCGSWGKSNPEMGGCSATQVTLWGCTHRHWHGQGWRLAMLAISKSRGAPLPARSLPLPLPKPSNINHNQRQVARRMPLGCCCCCCNCMARHTKSSRFVVAPQTQPKRWW